MHHGLLLVDKPAGCTSHDVVMSARKLLRQKKIGHCGTLDPDATGLLLLTAGRATRLTRFLIRAPKVYEGKARLGITTDTYDLSGTVSREAPARHLTAAEIDAAMESFEGNYLQTPPPYCAKKVGGVKFYELARRGEKVPETKKEVTVFELRRLGTAADAGDAFMDVPFRLSCSSGTYARSVVHELGEKLGCGATLAALRRSQIGAFKVGDARSVEALEEALGEPAGREASPEGLESAWVPFDEIQLPFDEVIADQQQERRIMNGQTVLIRDLGSREGDWLKVTNERHRFIAVGAVVETIGAGGVGVIQPKVVFH
jgi:tRNA pseudouridine55 synthase